MALIVNLFGGPGVGKSTVSHGIMERLKMARVNCEYVSEVAKDFVWEDRALALGVQEYVFGKQVRNLFRVNSKVDVIVTDSPILLSVIYKPEQYPTSFDDFVLWRFRQFNTANFYLRRVVEYDPIGRNQNEDQAREIDDRVFTYLNQHRISYRIIDGILNSADVIFEDVMKRV